MALCKLDKYYPDYRDETLACFDIKDFYIYAKDELIGSVTNILVDGDNGYFRYFVIDAGFWIFSIKVLMPVGLASVDYDYKRLSVSGLTKEQVNNLPEFKEDFVIDNDYEEEVRDVYRPLVTITDLSPFYHATTYNYTLEPYFYEVSDHNLKMYEEQLISRKNSHKVIRSSVR
jgi:PRC-barrel domain